MTEKRSKKKSFKLKSEIAFFFFFLLWRDLKVIKTNSIIMSLEMTKKWRNSKAKTYERCFLNLQVAGVEEIGHHLLMLERKKRRGESFILKSS